MTRLVTSCTTGTSSMCIDAAALGRHYGAWPTLEQAERLTGWGHTCRGRWNLADEQCQSVWPSTAGACGSAKGRRWSYGEVDRTPEDRGCRSLPRW
jgi:hypothetical protein